MKRATIALAFACATTRVARADSAADDLAKHAARAELRQEAEAEERYASDYRARLRAIAARLFRSDARAAALVKRKLAACDRASAARPPAETAEERRARLAVARLAVDVADRELADLHRSFETSGGKAGIERREVPPIRGEAPSFAVEVLPIPEAVLATIRARDEYREHVASEEDPDGLRDRYAAQAADLLFAYGQFPEALPRYRALFENGCDRDGTSYHAWEQLLTIATLQNDISGARALADEVVQRGCPTTDRDPVTHDWAFYQSAATAFERAASAPPGPTRTAAFRSAAEGYERALVAAPARDEAPEAALLGAHAWKQAGEFDPRMKLYELFITDYGAEARLAELDKGDPKATPPRSPDPHRYQERLKYLKIALDQRSTGHLVMFDFASAAAAYAAIAESARLDPAARKDAARNAAVLYAALGDPSRANRARAQISKLGGSPGTRLDLPATVTSTPANPALTAGADLIAPPLPAMP